MNALLLIGDPVLEKLFFDDLMFPVAQKNARIHPECVVKYNSGRGYFNKDVNTFVWKDSSEIDDHYKVRRHVWTGYDPTMDHLWSLLRSYRGPEGIKLTWIRLKVLVPSKTDPNVAGGCCDDCHCVSLVTDLVHECFGLVDYLSH